MKPHNDTLPNPKEIEKEIGEFLKNKFGDTVRLISPFSKPVAETEETDTHAGVRKQRLMNFSLKPMELIDYLDQFIIRQDAAKAVLATKVCTHFNRIHQALQSESSETELVGRIKNNILMIGSTGVGKTYMIRLIAKKLGVPFIKGDATKFSETGYVGRDVEDLVRDLVREADDDVEMAEYGIIYIDEIDKIASSRNLIGADVSKTGVQRALLKPMEETDVELKVPHDPISMMQELEHYQRTGKKESRTINTGNILFIVSGAFSGLDEIIGKRLNTHAIGFHAPVDMRNNTAAILKQVKTEDLVDYGFESEFIGRLPVKTVFDELSQDDLFAILSNPNNPIVLSKKRDFSAYGIAVKFHPNALKRIAELAFQEKTGARGLVGVMESVLLPFESCLPSLKIDRFPVDVEVIDAPDALLDTLKTGTVPDTWQYRFKKIDAIEKALVSGYTRNNWKKLSLEHQLTLTSYRISHIAELYSRYAMTIDACIQHLKDYYDEVKRLEMAFFNNNDINLILEEDAIDRLIDLFIRTDMDYDDFYRQLNDDFRDALKLLQERVGMQRFFIPGRALEDPKAYLSDLLREKLSRDEPS
ncbi:MAG: ATPase [Deltaproteobacteria bacterium]|nr:MAG: ATPase [Deltaproteobacteria bacterium]